MLKPTRLYLINLFSGLLPATRFYALKGSLYRWCGVAIGDNVRLSSSMRILGSGDLEIGDNTFVGHDTLILLGGAKVVIGKDVDISSRVTIVNGSHEISGLPHKAAGQGHADDILIGNGAWIGACTTVLGKAEIGSGAIVAAGALVSGKVHDNDIVAGVPAKLIRARNLDPQS